MTMMSEAEGSEYQPEHLSKNGRQVGAENVERLRAYLDELKASGNRLPTRKNQPDKSAIALACGFNRQTLYNNPEAVALLERAVGEIGLDTKEEIPTDSKAAHMQHQMDRRDRRIQQLEESLQARIAENQGLRQEIRELKEQLRNYALMEEVIAVNGRRFRP
jgi:hypothetical protein